jgi:hypothetical protein
VENSESFRKKISDDENFKEEDDNILGQHYK